MAEDSKTVFSTAIGRQPNHSLRTFDVIQIHERMTGRSAHVTFPALLAPQPAQLFAVPLAR